MERIDALEIKLSTQENRNRIAQDERLAFFSKAMPGSSGKHSLASKYIDTKYGKKCLFCDEEQLQNEYILYYLQSDIILYLFETKNIFTICLATSMTI